MRFFLLLVLGFWIGPAIADLYRWIDPETGAVKFSSYPPPWFGDPAKERRAPKVEVIPSRGAPAAEPKPEEAQRPERKEAARPERRPAAEPVEGVAEKSAPRPVDKTPDGPAGKSAARPEAAAVKEKPVD